MVNSLAAVPSATSTVAGYGRSLALKAFAAGAEAAEKACARLPAPPVWCLVFGTTGYDQQELLAGVRSVTGTARLAGCSGEGVISGACSEERDRAVTVLAVWSEDLTFDVHWRADFSAQPEACGAGLAAALSAPGTEQLLGILVLTEGLQGDCGAFLTALQQGLPAGVPVAGGCAGDDMTFTATYQYADDQVLQGGVCAIALRGRGEMRVSVSHGCVPVGLERTVTAASGGWLHGIDGQPAWSVFKEYLDGDPEDLNAEGIVHLCFGKPLDPEFARDYDPFIIHTPIKLDPENGALFFPGGGFSPGDRVRMTRRDPERIRQSAEKCAEQLADPRRPAFVIQFDCAGRGRILFGSCAAQEIIEPLQRVLGADVPWVGLHTYGEIAEVGSKLYYHNYTVALCAVYT
ncbi:MAG: FIST N-terminal domain-containing protein [Kofleriaceae bacterium]